jgi:hypothetical protein
MEQPNRILLIDFDDSRRDTRVQMLEAAGYAVSVRKDWGGGGAGGAGGPAEAMVAVFPPPPQAVSPAKTTIKQVANPRPL